MQFTSFEFLIFFPVVVLLFYAMPRKLKQPWLLAASYYFYMCWNAKYALLLLFSTGATYLSGYLIEFFDKRSQEKYKKYCVAGCFTANLMILFLFKYFDFAVHNINRLLAGFHFSLVTPSFDVILPVGISFYTFQALSYTMDVYRKDIPAEKNFFKYALFVSFFPQLVAGPIERSKNLLSQINQVHRFDFDRARAGFLLMLWGYFQKLILADRIAVIVNQVYSQSFDYPGSCLALASILFAIQIYCDFSGYSMIAIGASKVMGFSLMENFNCPYLAKSTAQFWKRWHISLTSWFRDYLYIPLGGNRQGTLRRYVNIMIVFLISGLWHGAAWTFIIWGALNGFFQVIGSITKKHRESLYGKMGLHTDSVGHRCLQILTTFLLVDFTWIFFRAESMSQAFSVLKKIAFSFDPWYLADGGLYTLGLNQKQFGVMILGIIILAAGDLLKNRGLCVSEILLRQDLWFRWLLFIGSIVFILVFGIWGAGYDAQAFVYFQF